MKIVKIEQKIGSCSMCPHLSIFYDFDFGGQEAQCGKVDRSSIENINLIPDWCVLPDLKEE